MSPSINPYCSHGHNVNHSCRQCLKHTLGHYGLNAAAYDKEAIATTARARTRAWHQRWDVPGDVDTAHSNRKRNYGIDPQCYQALLEAQQGVCALCGQPETSTIKGTLRSLAVDHDHTTGWIRGLLCARCNRALATIEHLGEDWGTRAYAYLRQEHHLVPYTTSLSRRKKHRKTTRHRNSKQ